MLEALRALGVGSEAGPIEVVSDSTYVVNCFRDQWWVGWQRNGWRNSKKQPVANDDLWRPLVELVQSGTVTLPLGQGALGRPDERPGRSARRRRGPAPGPAFLTIP